MPIAWRASGWLGALGRAVDALVFPWSCAVCGAEGSGGAFCPSCRAGLLDRAASAAQRACPRCALPAGPYADLRGGCGDCRGRSLGFEAALALGPYEGGLRELCLRMKRDRDAWLAPWLAGLWAEARGEAFDRLELPGDAWVVPVPLHWRRHWQRGYNQAEALAHGLSRRLGRRVRHPLRRVRDTHKLAMMSATDRARALRDAFRARPARALKGRAILLVDDVLTTGATCSAAARALVKAGAGRVVVAVIARTGKTGQ
ncbi:MAG: double zinc ribbon domain-containing protein [Isosphaeraceae bacterium]